ncbi:MAG TPA: hypothetical protein V6C99_06645 [Oculatellaceae cyanobacterium]
MSTKELERRLGLQYAQVLKESPAQAHLRQDCKEAIDASLRIMEYYNRIALSMQNVKVHARALA